MNERHYFEKGPFELEIFTPRDFIVKEVKITAEEFTFIFEDDITYHDGIKELFPGKKSLVLHFHLYDPVFFACCEEKQHFQFQKRRYVAIDEKKLTELCGEGAVYLSNYFINKTLMVWLYTPEEDICVNLSADYAEYEWVE